MRILSCIIKTLVFAAIVIPAYLFLSNEYTYSSTQNHINAWNRERVNEFYALPSNTLDLLFLGSSHVYCTFAPGLIDDAPGTESFNFGMPLQYADSTYFTLAEALKTQRPGTVVVDVYWGVLGQDFDVKQADTLFTAFDSDSFRQAYIDEIFPWNEKIKYHFSVIRYQLDFLTYCNTKLMNCLKSRGWEPESAVRRGSEYYDYRGFMWSDYTMLPDEYLKTNQFARLNGAEFKFSPTQMGYLDKIWRMCEDNDIRLVFVTAPVAPASMELISNYDAINGVVAKFAEQRHIPYLDYNLLNREEMLLGNENFRDDAHLNYSGAQIVSLHFAQWLTGS
jgi:hypothetical protein